MKILKSKTIYFMLFILALAFHANAEIKIFEIKSLKDVNICDGSISVLIDGNSGPYDITATKKGGVPLVQKYINIGNGLYTFDQLCADDYEISVSNKDTKIGGTSACVTKLSAKVIVCSPFDIVVDEKAKIVCNEDKDGFINISVKGGTPPYKYLWSSGQTTKDISKLEGDKKYSVTVTDINGCSSTKDYIKIDGQKIQLNMASVGASTKCDGSASLVGIGGNTSTNYKFLWNNGKTTQNISNICAGIYTIIVTSAEGCTKSAEIKVVQCSPKLITLTSFAPNLNADQQLTYCAENQNQDFYIYVEGGTLPIKYSFKGGDNQKTIQFGTINSYYKTGWAKIALLKKYKDLGKGSYTFSVEDACGNKEELVYECCQNIGSGNYPHPLFHINRGLTFWGNSCCNGEVELNFSKDDYPYYTDDDLCFVHWPDNTESKCFIHKFGYSGKMLSGYKKWTPDKKGFYTWTVTNRFGCLVYTGCFDYDPNVSDVSYCNKNHQSLEILAKIDPQISLKDLAQLSNNQYPKPKTNGDDYVLYAFYAERYCGVLSECGHPIRVDIDYSKDFVYTPEYTDYPCAKGQIPTCGKSITYLQGGIEVYDINEYNTTEECKINCGCIFPANTFIIQPGIPTIDRPIFVKTTKDVVRNPPNPKCNNKEESDNPEEKDDVIKKCGKNNSKGCSGLWVVQQQPTYEDCHYDIVCAKDPTFVINTNCGRIETCYIKNDDGKCQTVKFCPYPYKNLAPNHIVKYDKIIDCDLPGSLYSCDKFKKFQSDASASRMVKNTVKINETYAFVYPNPFEQQISVTIGNNKSKIIKMNLIDLLGRVIQSYDADGIEGENNFELNISDNLSKGMYYLQIIGEDYKLQYPIVHQ